MHLDSKSTVYNDMSFKNNNNMQILNVEQNVSDAFKS